MKRVVVFGGNGYVGQSIVSMLLGKGDVNILSISRSGAPRIGPLSNSSDSRVEWCRGDVLDPASWRDLLKDSASVISCIGAFGSDQFMEKINGDANVICVEEAKASGVGSFVYISAVESTLPQFVLRGYFEGKRKAEDAVRLSFPDSGFILRPGFIYGTRHVASPVGTLNIPLGLLGWPLSRVLSLPGLDKLSQLPVPGARLVLSKPLGVDVVAGVAAAAACGEIPASVGNILNVEDIEAAFMGLQR